MRITVNGEQQDRSEATVAALVAALGLDPLLCAVERNKQLVPRARHAETALADGDELEIVTLVGGG
ncbi:MAG: sulfur carrier protein ThiS [Planctomycetota bacterium]|nr:sulfur carrier protein ThiS [Planctomycetota bacterium]